MLKLEPAKTTKVHALFVTGVDSSYEDTCICRMPVAGLDLDLHSCVPEIQGRMKSAPASFLMRTAAKISTASPVYLSTLPNPPPR